MHRISLTAKWCIAGVVFVCCVAPTFISYQPYSFRWDDSVYLEQSIAVSRAFWAGSRHGIERIREIRSAMYGRGVRPPAMTVLGLPWGALRSWDAVGKCFFTLACWIGLVAALCLFLLGRIGIQPLYFMLASLCVGAALGPWPPNSLAHSDATAFMADGLFAWTSFAALLLIPYEGRTGNSSTVHTVLRGILWGILLSLGAMTKINFLYFVALILPVLFLLRYRRGGLRSVVAALAGFLAGSGPSMLYLAKYGRTSILYGKASSFGAISNFYENSFLSFLRGNLRGSPGLWLFALGVGSALVFIVFKCRTRFLCLDALPLLIVGGFGLIIMSSPNRELRFSFPLIVALPFLLAVLLSSGSEPVPRPVAALATGFVFLIFCVSAWPTRYRAQRADSLAKADAVLAQASRCHDNTILMATDSPSLNDSLLRVAIAVSGLRSPIEVNELGWSSIYGVAISEDYRALRESDLVVFQDDRVSRPPFTNLRVPAYRSYIAQRKQLVPIQVSGDVSAFSKHCP
jgi:hypothetical protein